MEKLTAAERKKLKAEAHSLKPVVQLGQKGLTPSLIGAVNDALHAHELIKIKFQDFKEDKKALAEEITSKTDSQVVSVIGNVVILYKKNEEDPS